MPPQTSLPDLSKARRRISAAFAAATIGLLVAGFIAAASSPANAADARVGLGTAAKYAVLAGSTVTNTGPSVITGDLGLSPGSSVTGFPPGDVLGSQHIGDAVADDAKSDLVIAYNDAAGRPSAHDVTGVDLGGMTLTPGVYEASSEMQLTGTLTLNAQGNPAAVFIFKAGSTLKSAPNSKVQFINGGSACNVYWKVGSSATLGTSTDFIGTIMALTSATLTTNAKVEGRVLARNGAVTLDTNVITAPSCAGTTGGGGGTGATGGTGGSGGTGGTATASTTPRGGATSPGRGSSGSDHSTGSTPTNATTTPVIPTGHPSTGAGVVSNRSAGSMHASSSTALFVLAGLAAAAALAAAILGFGPATNRRRRS